MELLGAWRDAIPPNRKTFWAYPKSFSFFRNGSMSEQQHLPSDERIGL
jgi:hypothetical protein